MRPANWTWVFEVKGLALVSVQVEKEKSTCLMDVEADRVTE